MSRFAELNDYMNTILTKLLSSQDLCKYVYYNSYSPLSEANIADTKILLFKNIFPCPIIPGVQDEAKTMINVVLDNFKKTNNSSFKNYDVIFNLFCHIDLWPITNGELRVYSILEEIDKLFNQQRVLGIGKLEFNSGRWLGISDKFSLYQIRYSVVDFN